MTEKDTNGSLQLIGKRIHRDNPQINSDWGVVELSWSVAYSWRLEI